VALIPIVQAATNAGTAFPVWNTINTRLPWPVVWGAGLVTVGLCLYVVYLCSVAVEWRRSSERRPVSPASAASNPERTRTVPVP
jgi:hypothetical protein